jgi:hypothetical protein
MLFVKEIPIYLFDLISENKVSSQKVLLSFCLQLFNHCITFNYVIKLIIDLLAVAINNFALRVFLVNIFSKLKSAVGGIKSNKKITFKLL